MNLWGAKYARSVKKCPPPETLSGGGGKIWNVSSKHLASWYTLNYTVQLPYKDYFISPSNKTSKKKQQINVFNALHSLASDFKSVIALSTKGGGGLRHPLMSLGRGTAPLPPCIRPWSKEEGVPQVDRGDVIKISKIFLC